MVQGWDAGPIKKTVERLVATVFSNKKTAAFGQPAVFETFCSGCQNTAGGPPR
jgi:hypothetical protein